MPNNVTDLLERPVYGMAQVNRVLGLKSGTAQRWIDGYQRGGKWYPPVIRIDPTGDDIVTWGEFVETRLLAEYRKAGLKVFHMRAVIERLRDRFQTRYPLAYARPYTTIEGHEFLLQIQEEAHLESEICFVVARNDQIVLREPAKRFWDSTETEGESEDEFVVRVRPMPRTSPEVLIDPLHQFGEPSVRNVPTAIVIEQFRSGESIGGIADQFDLKESQVQAALRYEIAMAGPTEAAA